MKTLILLSFLLAGCNSLQFPEEMSKFVWKKQRETPTPFVLKKTQRKVFKYELIFDESFAKRIGEENLHFKVPGGVAHGNDFSILEPSHKTSDRFVILYKNGDWIIKTYVYRQGCGASKPESCTDDQWRRYVRGGQIKLTTIELNERLSLEIAPQRDGTFFKVQRSSGDTFEAFVPNPQVPNGSFYQLHGWSPKSEYPWHVFMKQI